MGVIKQIVNINPIGKMSMKLITNRKHMMSQHIQIICNNRTKKRMSSMKGVFNLLT